MNNFAPSGGGLIVLSVVLSTPIEDVVVLIDFANEGVAEELAKKGVVGLVVKAEGADVAEEDTGLVGKPRRRRSVGAAIFLSIMRPYFCLFVAALPGKSAVQEVHEEARDSRSSRRACSPPRGGLTEA